MGQIRSDYRGGIVISGDKVAAVTGTWITSTSKACYRDKPDRPTGAVRICVSRRWI